MSSSLALLFCKVKGETRKVNFMNLKDERFEVKLEIKQLRLLILEIFKTLNDLNPPFMKDIFSKSINRSSKRFL